MDYLTQIMNIDQIKEFIKLLKSSTWLSDLEKKSFLGESLPHPPQYLVQAANDAVKEESEFYRKIQKGLPEVYKYLTDMQEWLERSDKTFSNFPGFPDQFEDNILSNLFLDHGIVENHQEIEEVIPDNCIGSFGVEKLSPDSQFVKIPEHKLNFDENEFLKLLAGSLFFGYQEKLKIIHALSALSQFQIDLLIFALKKERQIFSHLDIKYKKTLKKLESRCAQEWDTNVCSTFIMDQQKDIDVGQGKKVSDKKDIVINDDMDKIPAHQLIFDEKKFLSLLHNEKLLSVEEKKSVVKSISNFSQYHFDEVFELLKKNENSFFNLTRNYNSKLQKLIQKFSENWNVEYLLSLFNLNKESDNIKEIICRNCSSNQKSDQGCNQIECLRYITYVEGKPLCFIDTAPLATKSRYIPLGIHKLEFDKNEFLRLLASSISIPAEDKISIITSIPQLSQKQFDELFFSLSDEMHNLRQLNFSSKEEACKICSANQKASREWDEIVCSKFLKTDEKDSNSNEPINSFGIQKLSFRSQFIEIPHNDLDFDKIEFLKLLAGSISLTAKEKITVIQSIPRLSQNQIDEFQKILASEKEKFSVLDIEQKKELISLENKAAIEWDNIVCTEFMDDKDKIKLNDKVHGHDENQDELADDSIESSKTIVGSFGVGCLSTESKYIKIAPHQLNFNETELITLLAGSILISAEEKIEIIHSIPALIQEQIEELLILLKKEKDEFSSLNKILENRVRKLEIQTAQEWKNIVCENFKKEEPEEPKKLSLEISDDKTEFEQLLKNSISIPENQKIDLLDQTFTYDQMQKLSDLLNNENKEYEKVTNQYNKQKQLLEFNFYKEWKLVFTLFTFSTKEEYNDFESFMKLTTDIRSFLQHSIYSDQQDKSKTIVGSFGVESLSPMNRFIQVPSRDLNFDKTKFMTLLEGTISLNAGQKIKVIDSLSHLSQKQIDDLIAIFLNEKRKFILLDENHKKILRKLEKQSSQDWKTVCLHFLFKPIQDKANIPAFFEMILHIENRFQRYLFDDAITAIHKGLESYPELVFLYEYYFQAIKINENIQLNLINDILKKKFNEIPHALYDVLCVFFEFEEIFQNGERRFLKKIESYETPDNYEYVKPYLISKYHLYYGRDEDSLDLAVSFISEAINIVGVSNLEVLLFLNHHHIKVLLAKKDFTGIRALLDIIFENNDDLPLYYQYINLLGICFNYESDDYEKQSKFAMESFILDFAQKNKIKDMEEAFTFSEQSENHEESKNDKLWRTIQEMEIIVRKLGFINDEEQEFENELDILIGKQELDNAKEQIEAKINGHHFGWHSFNLMSKYFGIVKKENKLEDLYENYHNQYIENPNFKNTIIYFDLLDELKQVYRYKAREASHFLAKKYYFLPIGYYQIFYCEYYLFTQSTLSSKTLKSLNVSLSNGISKYNFDSISQLFRWESYKKFAAGNIFGLLDGILFNGNYGINIICSYNMKLNDIALAFTLCRIYNNPYDDNIYNALSIAFDKNQNDVNGFISIILLVKSLNIINLTNSVFLSNRTYSLACINKLTNNLQSNAYYSSLQSVQVDPFKTFNTYYFLLESADPIANKEIYLSAFYTAIYYNCPQLKDAHKQKANDIVSTYLDQPYDLNNFSFCVFLAKALIKDKSIWVKKKNIPDTESIAFDILFVAEKLLTNQNINDLFLGDHAHEEFLLLVSQDWYLRYRYPETSYGEKNDIKLDTLRKLEHLYPLCLEKENIRQVSMDYAIKEFIASLKSGRVVSNTLSTIRRSKPNVLSFIEQYQHRQTVYCEKLNLHSEIIDSYKKEIVGFITDGLNEQIQHINKIEKMQLQTDLNLVFSLLESESVYKDKLNAVFCKYGIASAIQEIDDHFIDLIQKFRSVFDDQQRHIQIINREVLKDQLRTVTEMFETVKQHHVMYGSEMFESFRKRIRHGWLIASLKDCFARFGLYMDSENETISPDMQKVFSQINNPQAINEIQTALADLTTSFDLIAQKLDTEILLIKDNEHTNGLLDYSNDHFNLKELVQQSIKDKLFSIENIEIFINRTCQLLDKRTLHCFEAIKHYLDNSVYEPLNSKLLNLEASMNNWKHEFKHIPVESDKILANIENAGFEFKGNIEDYKTWFDFYESAVRDFTLPEIVLSAEKLVWDINLSQFREKKINRCLTNFDDGVESLYFLGKNFYDILEIFKILFQNVVFHAVVPKDSQDISIDIFAHSKPLENEMHRLSIEFVSTHSQFVDVEQLKKVISDSKLRKDILLESKGTGLATIEDILLERLKGVNGCIDQIQYNDQKNTFSVFFHMDINEQGAPVKATKQEILQSITYETLALETKNVTSLKILIIEDQPHKFDALQDFVLSILTDSHITHSWDMETSCRLLLNSSISFDIVILDMTLPVDPCFDAYLESLGGLALLKVMQHNKVHIPTIIVTQYSNWQAEAAFNTRVYLENLDKFCFGNYAEFYKGSIRFSHTEYRWREKLKNIIFSMTEKALYYEERGDYSNAILFYENQLKSTPEDVDLLMKLAKAYDQTQNNTDAIKCYTNALTLQKNLPEALTNLALIYAKIGDITLSEKYFNQLKDIDKKQSDELHEKILNAKIQTINKKRQELYQNEMMATLGQMAGGMAHEFNTPLLAIKTIAQITTRFINKGKINEQKIIENLSRIVDVANKMTGQVKHIQALAKDDHLEKEMVDINTVIENAFQFFNEQLKNRLIYFIPNFQNNLPHILANPYRLEQVFINLIQNSRDSLETIRGRKKEIHVTTRLVRGDTSTIHIKFEDNGLGIKPENREQIFEPFISTKDTGKGIGLGLSIVKEIITELNGSIKVYSESSIGATFLIVFPLD